MKPLSLLGLAACLLAAAGCTAVYTEKPLGAEPVSIEAGDWEGTWRHKVDLVYVKVLDADRGVIQMAGVQEDDEAGFKLESWTIYLRTAGEWTLGSAERGEGISDSHEMDRYVWGRVKKDGDQIIFWPPDGERFKELVEKGTLPGRVDDHGNVILGELTADHLRRITAAKETLLDWEEPTVLFRERQR